MNLNIALNTIAYILIFIFPGILFRKFYFRGAFTKQFSHGNLFERFIITLFLSVICLFATISVILFFRYVLEIRLLNAVSYETIYKVFNGLKDNNLPKNEEFKTIYGDFTLLLLFIYILSAILGSILHSIIVLFKIDVISNVFRFNDKWHYHILGKTYNDLKGRKYLYTMANVLTEDSEQKIMYSGYLKDYCVDENHSITSIFLTNTHRYEYKEMKNENENREKNIRGNMIWIPGNKILNINFTHVTIEKESRNFKKTFFDLFTVFYYLLTSFTVTIFFFDNFFIKFSGLLTKTIFIMISIFIELLIYDLIKKLFNNVNGKVEFKGNISLIVFLIVPLLWTLGVYTWYFILIVYVVLIILMSIFSFFFLIKKNKIK